MGVRGGRKPLDRLWSISSWPQLINRQRNPWVTRSETPSIKSQYYHNVQKIPSMIFTAMYVREDGIFGWSEYGKWQVMFSQVRDVRRFDAESRYLRPIVPRKWFDFVFSKILLSLLMRKARGSSPSFSATSFIYGGLLFLVTSPPKLLWTPWNLPLLKME